MLAILLLLLLLLPTVAGAAELSGNLSAGVGYDSNVLRRETNPKGDINVRLSPRVQLEELEGRFQYSLRYGAAWEKYLFVRRVADRITDADHNLALNATYALNARTQLFVRDNFRRTTNLNSEVFDPSSVPQIDEGRFVATTNTVQAGLNRSVTRRISGSLVASHNFFESERPNSVDSRQYSLYSSGDYRINDDYSLGFFAEATLQDFDETQSRPSADTQIYNVSGTLSRSLADHTTLRLSVGPAFIRSQQRAKNQAPVSLGSEIAFAGDLNDSLILVPDPAVCGAVVPIITSPECDPTVPISSDDPRFARVAASVFPQPLIVTSSQLGGITTRVTIFGSAALTQAWSPVLHSTLSYRRTQGQAQGSGNTTIRDVLSLNNVWEADEWWSFQLRASWAQRESVNAESQSGLGIRLDRGTGNLDPPLVAFTGSFASVESKTRTRRWEVGLRSQRRITEHISLIADLIYQKQDRKQDVGPFSYDQFLAILSLRYNFQPIRVPIPDL